MMTAKANMQQEIWRQDVTNFDLWHGAKGVIVNTAALDERESYFDIFRVRSQPIKRSERSDFVSL